ncbi:MAG: UDP-N-acetylmuramate--L-alanine ligase [Coriobacteriia bacterium]|nr:UDP-N-acetylmuramate--L-alanine ligase [Coriobacteriia bacterium]
MTHTAYAHFIGIGGAGVSGLARVLHDRGMTVTGSDLKASRYATALEEVGVRVSIGHAAENLGDPEVVVVSSAIPESNPELVAAIERGIPVWPRAKMLAHLAGEDRTLCVAGTHGKTTTSSMLAKVLDDIGLDPTFLIGGELNDMGANARCGSGGYYVVEADESDGSFLFMEPHIAVITNMEADHLDHYGSFEEIVATFGEFIERTEPTGAVVVCADDDRLTVLARERSRARVVTYGRSEDADVRCTGVKGAGVSQRFVVRFPDGGEVAVGIGVPGEHNVLNATGVLAAAWCLGLDTAGAAEALGRFGGVRRRFDRVGEVGGVTVVDDYAHHPTEVRATLAGARGAGFRRIWAVFQPHRYSRTAALGADFGDAFGDADHVVLMDVYSAGEAPIPGVSGKSVLDALLSSCPRAQAAYFPHRGDIREYVAERVRPGDLVMTMGAGDVTTIAGEVVHALNERCTGDAS